MKVAYYSPLPPSRSGIADYSALLLPALQDRMDVVIARPGRLRRAPKADVALYHVGNDPNEHGWIVDALRRRPGVVVLHEFVLHHLVSGITLARGDVEGYCAALEREAGPEGRRLGHAVQQGEIEPLWETRATEFPLAHYVLDHATALIVHSQYVEGLARDAGFTGPIAQVRMPAWPVPHIDAARIEGRPVIGCFGHVNESKRIPQLVEAFSLLDPDARLLLVGSWSPRLPELELPERVIRRDYVPEQELWSLLEASDVVVSLRFPTMGETSAAAVRALSLGKPLVVSDVGAFRELPDEVAIKVPVGDGEVPSIVAAINRAVASPEMSRAALALARDEHRVEDTADQYAAALEQAVAKVAVTVGSTEVTQRAEVPALPAPEREP